MRSIFFEDFEVDQTFKSSGRTITETDLTFFSMLSGDWNPIHANVEHAKTTRYGQRVVHGTLGIAIATGMLHELGIFDRSAVAMLGLKEWSFLQPLFVGDTIRLQLTILDTEIGRSGRTGRVGRHFQLFNQNNELVQEGLSDVLVLTKTAPLS